ncbi:MAG: energy-coupling factor ABC transporter ATP-binding protein, partial [Chloroflexota bacterium]
MIEFQRFSFTYWGRSQPALRNVDLRIDDGERVLVTGPSGSGKSTLARCMNGLVPHFHGGTLSGRVMVDGLETTDTQPRDLATRVGMVFQDPENQLVATDLERDVAFGPENLGLPPLEIASRVNEALDALGIASLRGRTLVSLSGGEKQKVVIAGVLALRPRTLVLDEPSSE